MKEITQTLYGILDYEVMILFYSAGWSQNPIFILINQGNMVIFYALFQKFY
jgi:hypothetical protein